MPVCRTPIEAASMAGDQFADDPAAVAEGLPIDAELAREAPVDMKVLCDKHMRLLHEPMPGWEFVRLKPGERLFTSTMIKSDRNAPKSVTVPVVTTLTIQAPDGEAIELERPEPVTVKGDITAELCQPLVDHIFDLLIIKPLAEALGRVLGTPAAKLPTKPAELTPAQKAGQALAFANARAAHRQDTPLMLCGLRGHEAKP